MVPSHVHPMLATLVDSAPEGGDWLHEIKYDGYRLLCHLNDGNVQLYTRNANNWTDRFPAIAEAAGRIEADSAVLDGEVVALDENGISHFQALQQSLKGKGRKLYYYLFDALYLDGEDLRRKPLSERKERLKALLERSDLSDTIRYSDHVEGQGRAFHKSACERGLEGIISKRASRPYRERRTRDWVKVRCIQEQEFVIVGYTEPKGSRIGFGSLLLGLYEDGELMYRGRAGTGYDDETLRSLSKKLKRLERETPAVTIEQEGIDVRDVHWVEPKLVVEVAFTEWTRDDVLRHPTFRGLREDKPAEEVVREYAEAV